MPITIRPAQAADQRAIKLIVRAARINPLGLAWPRFLVAEHGRDIIGVGQVKPHYDGSRELASIAVVPEWQGQRIGSRLVRALLAREQGPIFLMCASPRVPFYRGLGFREIERAAMPPYFRLIAIAASLFARRRGRYLAVMQYIPSRAEGAGVGS